MGPRCWVIGRSDCKALSTGRVCEPDPWTLELVGWWTILSLPRLFTRLFLSPIENGQAWKWSLKDSKMIVASAIEGLRVWKAWKLTSALIAQKSLILRYVYQWFHRDLSWWWLNQLVLKTQLSFNKGSTNWITKSYHLTLDLRRIMQLSFSVRSFVWEFSRAMKRLRVGSFPRGTTTCSLILLGNLLAISSPTICRAWTYSTSPYSGLANRQSSSPASHSSLGTGLSVPETDMAPANQRCLSFSELTMNQFSEMAF